MLLGDTGFLMVQDWGALFEDLFDGGLYWSLVQPDHPPAQFWCSAGTPSQFYWIRVYDTDLPEDLCFYANDKRVDDT